MTPSEMHLSRHRPIALWLRMVTLKDDCKWRDEHNELDSMMGLQWPPVGFGHVMGDVMLDRVRELAFLMGMVFPAQAGIDAAGKEVPKYQFLDGGKSMGRLLGGRPEDLDRTSLRDA